MKDFRAFRIHQDESGHHAGVETLALSTLSLGEVVIKTAFSSVNYKDALAGSGQGKILRKFPLNGGIDVAGHVVASTDPQFKEGDSVLCTGCGLSETRDGGYSEFVRLESKWTIPLPTGLSLRESMILGTAGFTAALALYRMEQNGQTPDLGPLAVTGATGGVGSLAISIFSRAGYDVQAVSGKPDQAKFMRQLGASHILDRQVIASAKPLDSVRFGGALDNVGGALLAGLLAQTAPYGNVASCGLAGSHTLDATVMPFIIRGVSLLGIASAGTARAIRESVWSRLSSDWKPDTLETICTREVPLDKLPAVFENMLSGGSLGRTLVTF